MNVLQVFVKEVHSVVDITEECKNQPDWDGQPRVRVTMLTDCWGDKKVITREFRTADWEYIKKEGYFFE